MLQPVFARQAVTWLAQLACTHATQPWQSAGPPPAPVVPADPFAPAPPPAVPVEPAAPPPRPPPPPVPPVPPVPLSPQEIIRRHSAETTTAALANFMAADRKSVG